MAGIHTIEGYTYYYKGTRIHCRDITPHPLDYPIQLIISLLPPLQWSTRVSYVYSERKKNIYD
jgi:hypothetical protein